MNATDQLKQAAPASEPIGWAILELMGHRRLGGFVSEQTIAGSSFLRIDIPDTDAEQRGVEPPSQRTATQFYAPSSVYAITPTTEKMARAVAATNKPSPVQRWELDVVERNKALPGRASDGGETDDDDEDHPF